MEHLVHGLGDTVEAFLLSKRIAGLSGHTLDAYQRWLERFTREEGTPDPVAVQRFKTFFRWAVACGVLSENPLRGFTIRVPKTLPQIPTEDDLRAVLVRCRHPRTGRRNRALILVMADAGLRASETTRLLVEDWTPMQRSLFVRGGKGQKDRVVFVNPTTVRAVRDYLIQILHRLSRRVGLQRRLHPHALRHFAATSWLRNGMGLDEVRRLLGHESLNMTLRYSGNSHFFKLTNVGNSPALNVLIGLETLPPAPNVARSQIVLRRIALLPSGGEFQVEADFTPYTGNQAINAYGIVADYGNTLGEEFECVTEFPRAKPGILPGPVTEHQLTRRPSAR